MSKTNPTQAELDAARALLAKHDADTAAAKRQDARTALEPFAAAGFGSDQPLSVSIAEAVAIMRANMNSLGALDPSLPNLAFSGAQVLETFVDRIRGLIAQNAEPTEAPAEEA